ncbi:MAG: YcxB family protein [Velocimicrobium sp.]
MNIVVHMKKEFIYDLLLFHTYSRFSGFLINMLGLAVMITGGLLLGIDKISVLNAMLYIISGFMFLAYTPCQLMLRAKKMMKSSCYQNEILYEFNDIGILETVSGKENHYSWERIEKAISTPKDIAFYVGKEEALILPKDSFGENFMPVMKMIAEHVTRDKIYIR